MGHESPTAITSPPTAINTAAPRGTAPSATSLAPGFRFHPTDEELVSYYLKRKVLGKPVRFDAIGEVDIYKHEPWDLAVFSRLKTRDQEWYFYSALDKKYGNGARMNRATNKGYWKATGKDREIRRDIQLLGMKKTLVFHSGRAPDGLRTNWVMHEYRLVEYDLEYNGNPVQDAYVLCRVFHKNNIGPPSGNRYAPFMEEEWADDVGGMIPGVDMRIRAEPPPLARTQPVPLARAEPPPPPPLARTQPVPLPRAEPPPLARTQPVPLPRAEPPPLARTQPVPLARGERLLLPRPVPLPRAPLTLPRAAPLPLANGNNQIANGSNQIASGSNQVASGNNQMNQEIQSANKDLININEPPRDATPMDIDSNLQNHHENALKLQENHHENTHKPEDNHREIAIELLQENHHENALKVQENHRENALKVQENHHENALQVQENHRENALKLQENHRENTIEVQESHDEDALMQDTHHHEDSLKLEVNNTNNHDDAEEEALKREHAEQEERPAPVCVLNKEAPLPLLQYKRRRQNESNNNSSRNTQDHCSSTTTTVDNTPTLISSSAAATNTAISALLEFSLMGISDKKEKPKSVLVPHKEPAPQVASPEERLKALEKEIHQMSVERETFKLEMMSAEAMISILQSRIDALRQENEELKKNNAKGKEIL